MHRRFIAKLATGLSMFSIGCQSGDSPAVDAFSVTDSAGIEIVESAAPAWDGDGWRISDTPDVVIGQREGDERYLLGQVGWRHGAKVLQDGRIVVLDEQSALVRVYSPEGEHIEDWGGRGEGPGEFNYPSHIFPYRGDSILVSELGPTFTLLDDQGRFGRSMIPEMGLSFATEWRQRMQEGDRSLIPAESCCNMWGPLATGAFLLSYPEMIPTTGTGTKRGLIDVAVTPDSGGPPQPAGAFEGSLYRLGLGDRRGSFQFPPRFNMAVGSDGYFATEGVTYSIEEYDVSGRLRRIIRLARELRPVTDEVKAAYEARLREEILAPGAPGGHGSPEDVLEMMLSDPYPPHLPTFFRLLVDSEGNLWAAQYRVGEDSDMIEFFVFAAEGWHLGVVEVPGNLDVLQIGADFLLALARDDLDVNYVHKYSIEK